MTCAERSVAGRQRQERIAILIGKSLGHKTQAATAIYARLNLDPVRESVNKATEAMFAAAMKK